MFSARARLLAALPVLLLCSLGRAAAAPAAATAPAAAAPTGALCECRCCWDIGAGRQDCAMQFRDFPLAAGECGTGCTREACAARFAATCTLGNGALSATCRRAVPRSMPLLCFVVAAAALLLAALLRRAPPPTPDEILSAGQSMELDRREHDLLAKRDYGAADRAVAPEELPFLVTPPETDVVVEKPGRSAHDLREKRDYGAADRPVTPEEIPFLVTPPETDVVVGNLAPIRE